MYQQTVNKSDEGPIQPMVAGEGRLACLMSVAVTAHFACVSYRYLHVCA